MQDVAETASVSKATLYQIFESKEGLGTEAVSLLTMRMLEPVSYTHLRSLMEKTAASEGFSAISPLPSRPKAGLRSGREK